MKTTKKQRQAMKEYSKIPEVKEKRKVYMKNYLIKYEKKNKDRIIKRKKLYYLKNKEKIDNRNKKYMNEHKKEFLEYRKIYDAINKDKLLTYGRAWYHSQDKENYNKKKREWDKNKKYTDLNYALKKRLRLRVLQAFNKFSTTGKIRTSNDYNINYKSILEHLIKTLPADFHDKDYVIDHILPCCSFDLTNSEEVIKCFAPDNHQWLTREENAKKVSSDLKQRRIKLI